MQPGDFSGEPRDIAAPKRYDIGQSQLLSQSQGDGATGQREEYDDPVDGMFGGNSRCQAQCSEDEREHFSHAGPVCSTAPYGEAVYGHAAIHRSSVRIQRTGCSQDDSVVTQFRERSREEHRRIPGATAERWVFIIDQQEVHCVVGPKKDAALRSPIMESAVYWILSPFKQCSPRRGRYSLNAQGGSY